MYDAIRREISGFPQSSKPFDQIAITFFFSQVDNVKSVLRKELLQTVVEPTSPKALLSGSDVLFTGREFFVGISQWTNTEGAVAVAATWPEYPCTPVKASS